MKKSLIFVGMLAIVYANAQQGNVGINVEQPKATLDINPNVDNAKTTSTTNQGILAPRLSKTRIANIADTNLVEGTLVYATDNTYTGANTKVSKITEKGYYFYNGTEWVKIQYQDKGSRWINDTENNLVKLDTYSNGTTARTDLNNIRITDNGRFFLGREHNSTLESSAKLQVEGSVKTTGLTAISSGNVGSSIRLYNTSKEANNQAHQWTIYNMTSTAAESGYKDALVFWNYNKNNVGGVDTNKPQFFILDNGNVSVGGSPYIAGPNLTEKLTVHGTIKSTTLTGGAKKAVYATTDGVLTIDNSDAVDTNIYTSNGTLTEHRTVDMAGKNLLFTNNGRIGIGTDKPEAKLDVTGEIVARGYFISNLSSNLGGFIEFTNPTKVEKEASRWRIYNMTGKEGGTKYANGLQFWAYTADNTASIAQVVMADTGNVFIGYGGGTGLNATTREKLEVNGAVRIATTQNECTAENLGTIKFENDNFYGCKSTGWIQLNN